MYKPYMMVNMRRLELTDKTNPALLGRILMEELLEVQLRLAFYS